MIIVEEYPWTIFSEFPPPLEPVLEDYSICLWSIVPCADYPAGPNPLFDQQDDFYLPYANLAGFEFGGPALFVYARSRSVE